MGMDWHICIGTAALFCLMLPYKKMGYWLLHYGVGYDDPSDFQRRRPLIVRVRDVLYYRLRTLVRHPWMACVVGEDRVRVLNEGIGRQKEVCELSGGGSDRLAMIPQRCFVFPFSLFLLLFRFLFLFDLLSPDLVLGQAPAIA